MDARSVVERLRERGIRLEAAGERLRYRPRSAITPELLELLAQHKAEVLVFLGDEQTNSVAGTVQGRISPGDLLTCPVCGARKWTRNIPGGGVFCGGCSEPGEIGLSEGQYRPANEEELLRVAESNAYFRVMGDGECAAAFAQSKAAELVDSEPAILPYRCGVCRRPVTLRLESPGMYWFRCSCSRGFGRVAARSYVRLLAYNHWSKIEFGDLSTDAETGSELDVSSECETGREGG